MACEMHALEEGWLEGMNALVSVSSRQSWSTRSRLGLTGEVGNQRYQGWISVGVLEERIVEVTDNGSRIVSEAAGTGIAIDMNAVRYRLIVVGSLSSGNEASVCVSKGLQSLRLGPTRCIVQFTSGP